MNSSDTPPLAPAEGAPPQEPLAPAPPAPPAPDPFADAAPPPLAALGELPPPPPGDRLLAALAATRPVKPRRPIDTFIFALVVSVVVATIGYSVMGGPRGDLAALPRAAFLAVVLLCGGAFAATLYLTLVPARRQVVPRVALAGRVGIAGASAAAIAHLAFSFAAPDQAATTASATILLKQAAVCMGLGLGAAVAPIVLTLVAMRGLLGLVGVGLGVAIGAAAGALGGLFLHLHCGVPGVLHAGLSHGPAILLPAALLLGVTRLAFGRRAD